MPIVRVRSLPKGCHIAYDDTATAQSYELGGGVLHCLCAGVQTPPFAEIVIERGKEQIERYGKCHYFVDASLATSMTTEFRHTTGDFFRTVRDKLEVHMLLRSRLMEMAMNISRFFIGGELVAYADRRKWLSVLETRVPSFVPRPLLLPPHLAFLHVEGLSEVTTFAEAS